MQATILTLLLSTNAHAEIATATFSYDALNRLTSAAYGIPHFNESYQYDKAGNITRHTVTVTNAAPTDITLTPASVAENQPAGTAVGTLTATDSDVGDTFTFDLVPGAGDTNNAFFQVDGNILRTKVPLDRESVPAGMMSVRLRVTDRVGASYEEQVAIIITNVNEAPTDIVLSWNTVPENSATGYNVGSLGSIDQDVGDTFVYSLPAGVADNGSFSIAGNVLRTNAVFNFEAKNAYTVRVQTRDQGGTGLTFQRDLAISVTDLNEAPTAVNDTAATTEDVAIDIPVLDNDVDPDAGAQLQIIKPPIVCVQVPGIHCELPYTPPANFCGTDTFSYTMSDGTFSSTASVTVDVACVNDSPTDITLSAATIVENQGSGATVGTLATVDPDTGNTFAYQLVTGTGSTDNASFTLSGCTATQCTLKTAASFNFETKSSYSIRVQTKDQGNLPFEKVFTINVINVNEAPTEITLSAASVEENRAIGTAVGDFTTTDPDTGNTFTYQLIPGTGDTNNGSFTISGSTLRTAASFDFEAKNSYSIRVQTKDQGTLPFEKVFTITVINVNEAPTDIALAGGSVLENQSVGTTVGTLSTTDPDGGSLFTYSLVSGAGSTDNGLFQISGSTLVAKAAFNFEVKSLYSVRVRSTDGPGLFTEKAFSLIVTNVNEAPTDITLSGTSVVEGQVAGTTVGMFGTVDPDIGDSFTYTRMTGTGDTDNASFVIEGTSLKTNAVFSFATKNSYSIRVRSTDQGTLLVDKIFTITVLDRNDTPSFTKGADKTVLEDAGAQTVAGWATGISSGPANESGQALDFVVKNNNEALFATQPAVAVNGTLSFTPAKDANGSATVTVRLHDNGGTANGGTDTSAPQTFTITVTAVNDPPTAVGLSNAAVPEIQSVNTTIGSLSTVDIDSLRFTYTLPAGSGDNAFFNISGDVLRTSAVFDYETKKSYTIQVISTDEGGLATSPKDLTITVTDVLEPICGTAAGGAFTAPPAANLCNPGTASAVTTNVGTYTWSCTGGVGVPAANCTATRAYTVTPSAGSGGTLSPDTKQTVNYNQARQFTATAAAGYSILSVSGCGGMAYNNSDPEITSVNYSAGPVTGDCTVTASFADRTSPSSTIIDPVAGASFMAPTYRIFGSAVDTGTGLAKVEISINGGTWLLATGTASWSYDWAVPGDGQFTIRARATDKAGNVETPGAGITVTAYRRQPSAFTVSGRQLQLGGNPFTIKGVVYSPVPIGIDPEATAPYGDYFTAEYTGIQDRDLALLRTMGANAVLIPYWANTADHRVFLDKAYNGGVNPIYVIAGFWIDPGLDINPASPTNVRARLKADFWDMVETHGNHPAILLWSIGDDLNAPGMYGGNLGNLFSLIDEMAAAAHAAEGGTGHPVAAGLADVNLAGTIAANNSAAPNLDIWGVSVSRGATFGTLFSDYKAASGKPLVLLGYGIDAYDTAQGDEYENLGMPLQGDYAVALWGEIAANVDSCAGGTITEYSDEWWRGKQSVGTGCPDSDPAVQSTCGLPVATEPDGYLNEEWRGIVRVADNGSGPDLVQPREAYYALQYLWAPAGLSPAISESPKTLPSLGQVNLGQVSAAQTVTFTNSGNTNLRIGAIVITGTNSSDFATRNDGCSGMTLVPADSCTVQVIFAPTGLNARNATLSVPSNDTARGTLAMGLQGSGIDTLPPTGTVTINGGAVATQSTAVTLTLTAVDFGGGPIRMCISNTETCGKWEAFASTKNWSLSRRSALKTVRVWFRDQQGNTSETPYSDTIELDAKKPSNGTVTVTPGNAQLSVSWNGFTDGKGSGITGYRAVFKTGGAPVSCTSGTQVPGYDGIATSLVHTGLVNGEIYGYRICAIDAADNMSSGATKTGMPVP